MTAAKHSTDFTIAIDELGDIASYRSLYASGVDPIEVILTVYDRIASSELQPIWINLVPRENVLSLAANLLQRKLDGCDLPLLVSPLRLKTTLTFSVFQQPQAVPISSICRANTHSSLKN